MNRLIRALIAVLALASSSAQAEDSDRIFGAMPYYAGTNQAVVDISDDVDGGCWTNANATKDAIELTLRKFNIKTFDDMKDTDYSTGLVADYNILANGYSINDGETCVAHAETKIYYVVNYYVPYNENKRGVSVLATWSQSLVMSGPKNDFSSRLKEAFVNMSEKFVLKVEKSKDEAAKYPDVFVAR